MDYTHVHRMLWAYAAAKRHRELHSLLSLTAVSGSAPFWASVFPPHPSTLAAFPASTGDASEAHRAAQQASSVYTALLSVLQFCTEAQNIAEAHAATTGDSQPTENPSAQQGGGGEDTKATSAVAHSVPQASIALHQFGFASAAAFAEALHSAVEIDAFVDAAATFLVMTKLRCALAGAILKSMEQAHTSALGEMSQVDTQKACDATESLLDAEHLFILLAGAVGGDASALIAPGAAPAEDPSITRASATAAVPRNHRTSDEIIASPSVRSSGVAPAASTQPPPPATDASETNDAVEEGEHKKVRGGEVEADEDAPTAAAAGTTAGDAIEVTSSVPTTARTTAAVTTTSEGISGRSTLTGPSGETPVILAQVPQSHPSSGRPSEGVVLSHVTSGRPSSAPAPLFTQQGGATPLASGNSAVVSSAQTRDSAISAASAATASGVSAGSASGVSVSARSLFSMASVFSLSTSGSCVDAALAVLRALQDPTSRGAATIDLATLADELLAGVRPTADPSTATDQQERVSSSAGNLTTQSTTQSTNSQVVGAAVGNACPAVADGKRGRDEVEPRRPDEGVPPRPSGSAGPRLSSDAGSPLGRASVVTTTSTVLGSEPTGRHSGRRSGRRSHSGRRTKGSGIVVTEFLFDKALRETKAALRRRVTALLMTLLPTESLPPCCTPSQQLPRGEEVSSTLQQGGVPCQAQASGTPTGVSGRVSVNEETKANGGDAPSVVDVDKQQREDAPAKVDDAVRRSSVVEAGKDASGGARATQASGGSSGASPSPFAPFTASQLSAASQAVRSQNSAVEGRGSARGFDPAALFTQLSSVSTQKSTQKSASTKSTSSTGAGPQHHFVASSSRDSHLSSPSQRPTSVNHGEAGGHGILLSLPTAPAAGGGRGESMPAPSPHRPSQTAARGTPPRQGVASSSTDRGPIDLTANSKFSPDGQTQQRSPGIAPPSLQTPVVTTTTTTADLAAVVKAAGLEPLPQRGSRRVEDEDNGAGGDLVALTQGSAAAVAALEELQMLRAAGEEALGGNVEVGMSQEAMARAQVHTSSSDNTASGLETAAPSAAAATAPRANLETQRLSQSDSKQPGTSSAPSPAASHAAMDATQALHDRSNQGVDKQGPTGELPDEVVVGEEITEDMSPERATQQRITVSSTDATPLETPNVKAIRQRFRDAAALAAVVSSKPFDEDSQPPLEQALDTTTTTSRHATRNHAPGPSADTDRHRNSLGFAQFELWPSSDHAASSATTTAPPAHNAPPTSTATAIALAPVGTTAAAQPQPRGRQQFVNHPHAAAMSVRAYAPIPAAPTATSDSAVAGNGRKPKPPAVQEGPVLGNNKPLDTGAISRLAATWAEAAGDIPAAAQPASPAVLRAAIAQSRGRLSGDASPAAGSARASAVPSVIPAAGTDLPSTPATPITSEAAAALHNIGVALQRQHIPVSSGAQNAAMPIAEVMGAVRPTTARRSFSVPASVTTDAHLAPHPKLPLSTGPPVAAVAPESSRSTPRVAVAFTAADVATAVQRADATAGASSAGKRSSTGQARLSDAPPAHVDEDVGAPVAVGGDPSDPVTAFFSNIAARPTARGGIPAVQRTDDFDSIETPLFSQSSQPDAAGRPKGKKQPRVHATLTTTTTTVDPTHPNPANTNRSIAVGEASTVSGGRRTEEAVDAGGAAMRNLAAIAARHRRIAQEIAAAQQSSSHGLRLMQDTPQDAGRAQGAVGGNVDEDDTLFGQASSRPASVAPASAAVGAGSAGAIPGRRRHAFTEAEDRALIEGVARFTGPSRMTQIYNYYLAKGNVWHPARTPQQLSDHWRQVVRKRTRDIGSVDSGVVGRARAMCEEDIQFTQ